jgi:glucose/arabinose dehydrogenase
MRSRYRDRAVLREEGEDLVSNVHRRAPARTRGALALAATLSFVVGAPALAGEPAAAVSAGLGAAARAAEPEVSGLSLVKRGFTEPVFVTHVGDDRLFVVEQPGRIRILRPDKTTSLFLDIRGRVGTGHPEQGLLGLAFHPGYKTNRLFYVNYTDNAGDTVVAEFKRSLSDPGEADPTTFRQVMRIPQPYDNHNGGWLGFKGSFLYIATGDGGSGGDPGNRAQDIGSRLGKILRIDPVDPDGSGSRSYRVPADNPFVGRTGNDLIWSLGLRNPWRVSFDRLSGDLWIADVGQNVYEEVSHAGDARGRNFGWRRLEGRHLYPSGDPCTSNCKTLPIIEYRHGTTHCSVTGGYVARRPGAALEGRYLYGDYCSGRIWDVSVDHAWGDTVDAAYRSGRFISSFGEGADGRIYLTDLYDGSVWYVQGT